MAFERTRSLILGEVVDAPADLPRDTIPEGVVFRRGALVPRIAGLLGKMRGPAAAVTLGRTIVLDPAVRLTHSLLAHELVHVEQWKKDRLFPLRYAAASLRHGYWNNPYEVEARAAQPLGHIHSFSRGIRVSERSVVTIERHILEREREFPEATGAFSSILYDLALAAKLISREVRRAGLVDILGHTGSQNVHGERVKKLDEFAHDVIYRALDHCGHLCVMASEEADDPIQIPEKFPTGGYVLLYDPLDGSSNIDANVSVGTIFSIHRKVSDGPRGTLVDLLQAGSEQVAAGYVLYGSSTILVYTTGNGVHGFTLDPSIGEFVLSHPQMQIPAADQRIYSINEGNYRYWSDGQKALVDHLKALDDEAAKPFTSRYVGSMVADIHRTLLYGGLFMYPADSRNPDGKLRLLYEASPMAFLVEQAGGRATDGVQEIMSIRPTDLHQRTPLFVGSPECMAVVDRFLGADTAVRPKAVAAGAGRE